MMRNPALMQEMQRNNDRAMANIDAHPEGFNALRRMYQEVQQPLADAAEATGSSATLGRILHPSPASPAANRDFAGTAARQLTELGLW